VYLALPRMLAAVGVASLLAACSTSSGTVPSPQSGSLTPTSASQAAASASRGALERSKKAVPLAANPASLQFASADTAAKTVAVSGGSGGTFDVSIAGTGNCPAVVPAKITVKNADDDDHGRHAASPATITVTPAGAGPAACVISLTSHADGDDEHDGDRDHHDGDRDRHDGDRGHHDSDHHGTPAPAAPALTIPVTVDAPVATPTPVPTPTASPTCGTRGGC
jgi:hypothetical protein